MIDDIDCAILRILQANARTPNAQIARDLGIAPSAILERIRKLEDRGVIKGYTAIVDADALGYGLTAFVLLRTQWSTAKHVAEILTGIPQVQEVHHIAGEDCYILKLRAANPEALGNLLQDHIGRIEGVASSRTLVVLGTEKESPAIHVPDAEKAAKRRATVATAAHE